MSSSMNYVDRQIPQRQRGDHHSWQQRECLTGPGTDHAEMPPIRRSNDVSLTSLGAGDHRCVHRTKWEVSVPSNQVRHTEPIGGVNRLDIECAGSKIAEKANFSLSAETGTDQINRFGYHQCRYNKDTGVRRQQDLADVVKRIVSIDVGIQRAGIDDYHSLGASDLSPTHSVERISSIRAETSARPLAPAPAAKSFRDPPKCSSNACLVTAEMVTPRRAASVRRAASSDSGIFTEVRFMVCQHTM